MYHLLRYSRFVQDCMPTLHLSNAPAMTYLLCLMEVVIGALTLPHVRIILHRPQSEMVVLWGNILDLCNAALIKIDMQQGRHVEQPIGSHLHMQLHAAVTEHLICQPASLIY